MSSEETEGNEDIKTEVSQEIDALEVPVGTENENEDTSETSFQDAESSVSEAEENHQENSKEETNIEQEAVSEEKEPSEEALDTDDKEPDLAELTEIATATENMVPEEQSVAEAKDDTKIVHGDDIEAPTEVVEDGVPIELKEDVESEVEIVDLHEEKPQNHEVALAEAPSESIGESEEKKDEQVKESQSESVFLPDQEEEELSKESHFPLLPPRENTAHLPPPPELPSREITAEGTNSHIAKSITEEDAVYINANEVPSGNLLANPKNKSVRQWFKLKLGTEVKLSENDNEAMLSQLDHPENFDLALYRLQGNENPSSKQQGDSLRSTFNIIKTGIEYTNNDALIKGIDWEFWTEIVADYSKVVKEKPNELLIHITNGIPRELRGMIWQLITNSKSFELEEIFRASKPKDCPLEKAIRRDLVRTSFVRDSAVVSKIEDLYEVIKAYSLYDPEVGYTQGMAFITVPLLMNMESNEAFSMLVKLMKNYEFRELYLPDMPGLHLKLYEFDRLLEDLCPDLHIHLLRQGVRSSMYVTQWVLTLFGYKFPLDLVLRIFDVVIAEGLDSILKFAINLMLQSKDYILNLKFDALVPFLKEKIFYYYLTDNEQDLEGTQPVSVDKEINLETYDLEAFVRDAMSIKILPLTLNRYAAEYEEIHRIETERKEEIEELRIQNGHLMREIRNIESSFASLNIDNAEIVQKLVDSQSEITELEEENGKLKDEINNMNSRIESLEQEVAKDKSNERNENAVVDSTNFGGVNLELEIQNTMARNLEVMEENRLLEEQLSNLQQEYSEVKSELENVKASHNDLKIKWGSLKKGFW